MMKVSDPIIFGVMRVQVFFKDLFSKHGAARSSQLKASI